MLQITTKSTNTTLHLRKVQEKTSNTTFVDGSLVALVSHLRQGDDIFLREVNKTPGKGSSWHTKVMFNK